MPPTRRGTRTRRHLIECCAGVFDRNGFTASTLNQMVDATGYTRGAFYFHFDSKDALAEATVADQAARWGELHDRVRVAEPDPLRALLRLLSERILIARSLPQTYSWWMATVRTLLEEAEAAALLARRPQTLDGGPTDLDTLANYLVATWHGSQQQAAAGRVDLAAQMHIGWRLVLAQLCRAPEPLASLLELNDRLGAQLREDPAALLASLPTGLGPSRAGEVASGDVRS